MSTTRRFAALSVLPVMLAAGQGAALAAPGQPGLAVPGEGQPGLTVQPQPEAVAPAPSLADWIPDPPTPPARPKPHQQTAPDYDTWVQPEVTDQGEAAPEQPATPVDPHTVRLGTTTVSLPDVIDSRTRDKIQAYADWAEWQIAAVYDGAGFSRDESDRRAASTLAGGVTGAYVGTVATGPVGLLGCAAGMVAGGVIGGVAAGIPTAGAGSVLGAAAGGVVGCMAGAVILAAPVVAVSAAAGAALGGATAGALGGGVDVPQPAEPAPPLIEVALPNLTPVPSDSGAAPVSAVVAQVDSAVASLRTAVDAMPPLDPGTLGPVTGVVNDFLAAVQAGSDRSGLIIGAT